MSLFSRWKEGVDAFLDRWNGRVWLRRAETVLLLALAGFALHRLRPQLTALTGIGASEGAAPSFSVVTLDGDTLTSSSLRGKVAVVNVWATWCPPCRLEMPSLEKLHEERSAGEVVVLGISVDAGPEGVIRDFVREHHITYPVARMDPTTRAALGGVTGVPTTLVLDRNGQVRNRVVGYFLPPALKAAVDRIAEESGN